MARPFITSDPTANNPSTEKGIKDAGAAGSEGKTHTVKASANKARTNIGTFAPEITKKTAKKALIRQKGNMNEARLSNSMGSKKSISDSPKFQPRIWGISSISS